MNKIYIKYLDNAPDNVRAFTVPTSENCHTIFLNSKLNSHGITRALEHELAHIRLKHFSSDKSLEQKELEVINETSEHIKFLHLKEDYFSENTLALRYRTVSFWALYFGAFITYTLERDTIGKNPGTLKDFIGLF